jgi:hypothetical protein
VTHTVRRRLCRDCWRCSNQDVCLRHAPRHHGAAVRQRTSPPPCPLPVSKAHPMRHEPLLLVSCCPPPGLHAEVKKVSGARSTHVFPIQDGIGKGKAVGTGPGARAAKQGKGAVQHSGGLFLVWPWLAGWRAAEEASSQEASELALAGGTRGRRCRLCRASAGSLRHRTPSRAWTCWLSPTHPPC